MKSLKVIFRFLSLLLVFLTFTSVDSTDILYWTEGQKLTWNDFAGMPNYAHTDISAITSSGIVCYKGCKDGDINFRVRAYFEKNESWVKQEAHTNHHLVHEQIHFDITELYVRKLRKALAERQFICGQEAEFDTFVQNWEEAWQVEQQNYDLLSHHSSNKAAQRIWYYKIKTELSLLDEFKEVEVEQ